MGEVLPFPLSRRRAFVMRQAAWFAEQRHQPAEADLRRQLRVQADALRRRGVDHGRIDAECAALESAIRAQVLRWSIPSGGAA